LCYQSYGLHRIAFTLRSKRSCEFTGRTTKAVSAPLLVPAIAEPVDDKAKEKNEEFELEDAKIVVFAQEFNNTFCRADVINWQSRVKFNSDEIGLL
jgi:hypothetical protein